MTAAADRRLPGDPYAIPAKLAVTRLHLTNFRSYAAGELAIAGGAVVLAVLAVMLVVVGAAASAVLRAALFTVSTASGAASLRVARRLAGAATL